MSRLANLGNEGRSQLAKNPQVKEASKSIQKERGTFAKIRDKRDRIADKIPENLLSNWNWLYRSNDPRAVGFRKADKEYTKAWNNYNKAVNREASKLVGLGGYKPLSSNKNEVNMWNSFTVKDQVANAIMYEPMFNR